MIQRHWLGSLTTSTLPRSLRRIDARPMASASLRLPSACTAARLSRSLDRPAFRGLRPRSPAAYARSNAFVNLAAQIHTLEHDSPHALEELHDYFERQLWRHSQWRLRGARGDASGAASVQKPRMPQGPTWFTHGQSFSSFGRAVFSMISKEMSSSIPTPGPVAMPENSTSSRSSASEAKEHGVSSASNRSLRALSVA